MVWFANLPQKHPLPAHPPLPRRPRPPSFHFDSVLTDEPEVLSACSLVEECLARAVVEVQKVDKPDMWGLEEGEKRETGGAVGGERT